MTKQPRDAARYAPSPRPLTDLEFVALRLHEAAIRKDGREALNMDTAVASVDAARALLKASSR